MLFTGGKIVRALKTGAESRTGKVPHKLTKVRFNLGLEIH